MNTFAADPGIAAIRDWSSLWLPPTDQSLSEWAEENFYLSSDYSSRSGPIQLFNYQREVFDSFTDARVGTIVLMCSTQMLKTVFIQAACAYLMAVAPGPALLVLPKEGDAKAFSKERLTPMLRDIPCLQGIVTESDKPGKSQADTMLTKVFKGGTLSLAGGVAPGNLARRSIRYLFVDETDKLPVSAGKEGDPISLAVERTVTYGSRRKIILTCSPTVKDRSRIARAYEDTDQRQPWVPCHQCGQQQVLKWSQVKWNNDLPVELRPESAYYECQHCEARWIDLQRLAACERVVWKAQRPFVGKAGFWISHLYSPYKTLNEMVGAFLAAKHSGSKSDLQVFVNTTLAETFEEYGGTTPDELAIYSRRESYPFNDDALVPERGVFLTAAVDVQEQPPRLEVEVVAWGRGRESWSMAYYVIQAFAPDGKTPLPVASPEVWEELDKRILQRDWNHEDGGTLPIMVMAIDTGSNPKPVYDFAVRHAQAVYSPAGLSVRSERTVLPIKGGKDTHKIIEGISKEDAARKRQGVHIVTVGTHCAKQELFDSLKYVKPNYDLDGKSLPVPNCLHFPEYELNYFKGLCSEQRIVKENNVVAWEKKSHARNEPLDLKVYNRAAATVFGIDRFQEEHWLRLEAKRRQGVIVTPIAQPTVPAPAPVPAPVVARPPVRRDWLDRRTDWLR